MYGEVVYFWMLFEEKDSKKLQQLDRMICHLLGEKIGGDIV